MHHSLVTIVYDEVGEDRSDEREDEERSKWVGWEWVTRGRYKREFEIDCGLLTVASDE